MTAMQIFDKLDALGKTRALTDAESRELERVIAEINAPIRAAPIIAPCLPRRWNRAVGRMLAA